MYFFGGQIQRTGSLFRKAPESGNWFGFFVPMAFLQFVFIFIDMKSIKLFLLFGVGLLLAAPSGFASDGTKITKDCNFDTEYQDLAICSYEFVPVLNIVVIHEFSYFLSDSETLLFASSMEGSDDVGWAISEFGTLTDIFILDNKFAAYPITNEWLKYKNELAFKLTFKYSKAPICDNLPYRC